MESKKRSFQGENRKRQWEKGEAYIATLFSLCTILASLLIGNFTVNDGKIEWKPSRADEKLGEPELSGESGEVIQISWQDEDELILPTFQSKEEILEMVKKDRTENWDIYDDYDIMLNDALIAESSGIAWKGANNQMESATTDISPTSPDSSVNESEDYSTTNVQVKDVDEAEIVKTNGDFIYYLSGGVLSIFDVRTSNTKLVKTIRFDSTTHYYSHYELYIDEDFILVIGQEARANGVGYAMKDGISYAMTDCIMPIYGTDVATVYVYDIHSYELVKKVSIEGNYVSSRKIGKNLYVVANKYLNPYTVDLETILPVYSEVAQAKNTTKVELMKNIDNLEDEVYQEIPATSIHYFPEVEEKSECTYMMIASLNLDKMEEEVSIDTYLGAGNEIYCSKKSLYVTRTEYPTVDSEEELLENSTDKNEGETVVKISKWYRRSEPITRVHKFQLVDGKVKYAATGVVNGTLLNQYSMDEYQDYFRITTTSEEGNALYVLNEKLEVVGALENLAQGEKIYATRFMGDKCYLVTYKTVDPLFVIDLSEPENPNVLGELKIPGYSTYLHPLGENYLIGFGEESVEKSYLNWKGEQNVVAYNVGMKLAIFDVSDLSNPKEVQSIQIGGRGSYSELLNNPKVLYYDEEEGIFAFPATLTEETKFYQDGTPMYGNVVFRGALVYHLDIEAGIELLGQIEHDTENKNTYGNSIERILRIRDNLYTLSPKELKVTDINTMQEIKEGACIIKNNE